MIKALVLILSISASALAGSTLNLGLVDDTASLYRSGSQYNGRVSLDCRGGSGNYRFEFTSLPAGWTAQNNVISVPNIVNVNGEFVVGVKVTDDAGNVFSGNIRINVNGVNVVVSTGTVSGSASLASASAAAAATVISTPVISAPNPAVIALYDSYSGLPSGSAPVVLENGRYPTAPSPSGKPATPNIIQSIISTAQASYIPARDAKTVSVDEVKRNAAFNRQLNANKAVANLIAIIQQLTANVNAAKSDISVVEKTLAGLDTANNECNNKIYDQSNTRTKIQNAIKDRQDKITNANKKVADLAPIIADLTKTKDNLVNKRTDIENVRSPNAAKLADLERQLKDCNSASDNLQKQIDDLNNQINGLKSDIKTTQDDAASAPEAIALIDQQVPIIDGKIANLKKQLEDAQNEKNKLLQDKIKYEQTIDNANRKVKELQRKIDDLTSRVPALNDKLAAQKVTCDGINKQIDDLRNQISQKEADYKILVEQIKTQDGLINDRKDQSKKVSDSVSGLPAEIASLQQELSRVEEAIRRQYYICNDAGDAVRKAKQSLDALSAKYTTQSGWLRDANNNLEKARAEKDLADQAVTEIITSSTTALPFSVVPNGSDATSTLPTGNNPSGSAVVTLGSKSLIVGDLNNYLSQSYGANVDVTKSSSVTSLFPISSLTTQALTGQNSSGVFGYGLTGSTGLGTFSCNASGGLTQGQGQVVSVEPGQIVLSQANGGQITLQVASCSRLNAVQSNFSIVPRTQVYYKGVQRGSVIQLQQLTCV